MDEFFVPLIWSHIQQHKKAVMKLGSKDRTCRKVRESLNACILKWSDGPANMISKKALEFFETRFPDIDPKKINWHQKYKLGKDDGKRGNIIWEHTTPVNLLLNDLLEANKEDEVISILKNYSGVCLITRGEDDTLNSNKMRVVRPGGWEKCYEACGIEVVRWDI
jgi:hypothetical protein